MAKYKTPKHIVKQENLIQLHNEYFQNLACSIIKWNGLPDNLRSTYIEKLLFENGVVCFFDTQKFGYLVLPVALSDKLNVMYEPTQYTCYSHIETFYRSIDDAVLIKNNEMMIPTFKLIQHKIVELVDIREAMQVNRNASCKTPLIITTDEKNLQSAVNEFTEVSGNKPVIFKTMGAAGVNQITYQHDLPHYWGRELREEYNNVYAEILTTLGILSNPVSKAERVNTLESTSNRGELIDNLDTMLQARELACEQINKMFGLNLSVEINNDYIKRILKQFEIGIINEESENNEQEPEN